MGFVVTKEMVGEGWLPDHARSLHIFQLAFHSIYIYYTIMYLYMYVLMYFEGTVPIECPMLPPDFSSHLRRPLAFSGSSRWRDSVAKFPATIQKIRFQAAQVDKEMQGAVLRGDFGDILGIFRGFLGIRLENLAQGKTEWRGLGMNLGLSGYRCLVNKPKGRCRNEKMQNCGEATLVASPNRLVLFNQSFPHSGKQPQMSQLA